MGVASKLSQIKRLFTTHKQIRAYSKVSFSWFLKDFIKCKNATEINLEEYFIYEFEKQSEELKLNFLSNMAEFKLFPFLNPDEYWVVSKDKYICHLMFEDLGLPMTELYLYYYPEFEHSTPKVSNDLKSTIRILKEKDISDFILKPVNGNSGVGIMRIKRIDFKGDDDCILYDHNGKSYLLSEILGRYPILFEKYVVQTEQFSRFNDSSVNTIRFMTSLYPDNEVRIFANFIRIGRAGSCIDNIKTADNINALIDIKTGYIYKVLHNKGWRNFEEITHHPDSGNQIKGELIENWEEICKKVKDFHKSHPYLKVLGWDIAVTDNGPVILETNGTPGITGQYMSQSGWRNEILRCYNAWKDYDKKYDISRKMW